MLVYDYYKMLIVILTLTSEQKTRKIGYRDANFLNMARKQPFHKPSFVLKVDYP